MAVKEWHFCKPCRQTTNWCGLNILSASLIVSLNNFRARLVRSTPEEIGSGKAPGPSVPGSILRVSNLARSTLNCSAQGVFPTIPKRQGGQWAFRQNAASPPAASLRKRRAGTQGVVCLKLRKHLFIIAKIMVLWHRDEEEA